MGLGEHAVADQPDDGAKKRHQEQMVHHLFLVSITDGYQMVHHLIIVR